MKKITSFTLLLFTGFYCLAQNQGSLINRVMERYGGKWPKTLTFTQKTTFYTQEGKHKQTWYEAGIFPDKFRIDLDVEKGSSLIFNGDKEYRFKDNKLVSTGPNNNPLIYLIAGMYFDTTDIVQKKLTAMGVNVNAEFTTQLNGRRIQVVGSHKDGTMENQIWYDSENLYIVRFIQWKGINKMDIHFSGQKKINGIWHETIVDIFRNNQISQKEEYRNLETNVSLDPDLFNPEKSGSPNWTVKK